MSIVVTDEAELVTLLSVTLPVTRETVLEVRNLNVVDVLLGAVAAPNRIRMKPTGAKPSPKGSETIASRLWQRICSPLTEVVVCLRRLLDVKETVTVSAIESAIVIVSAIVTVTRCEIGIGNETVIVIMTGHHAQDGTTMATTIVNAGIERMNGSGCIAGGLIEVRVMSSPMEMNGHQLLGVDDKMTKTTRVEEIRETPR